MEMFLNAIIVIAVVAVIFTTIFIYAILKDDYNQGYYDSKMYYTMYRKVKMYENPSTSYQLGWNKAVTDLSRKI